MHRKQIMSPEAAELGFELVEFEREPDTVLVAEDDDALREQISAELRSQGFNVVEVEDGLEFEDYLSASRVPGTHLSRPDVIVAEAVMPGRDGLDVLRDLRQAEAAMPFIVITAQGDAAAFEGAELLGAEYVVEKPFDLEDLSLAVFEAEEAYG